MKVEGGLLQVGDRIRTDIEKNELLKGVISNFFNDKSKYLGFINNLCVLANTDKTKLFEKCTTESIVYCALHATKLDLPLDNNFSYACIVPYKGVASLQIGYHGYIQFAVKSGFYKNLNMLDVREGEIISNNRITGEIELSPEPTNGEIIGYLAYFKLINGFEKYVYMTNEELWLHAQTYSKMVQENNQNSVWFTNPDAMMKKTVMLKLLRTYAPVTADFTFNQMISADQKVYDTFDGHFADNPQLEENKVASITEGTKLTVFDIGAKEKEVEAVQNELFEENNFNESEGKENENNGIENKQEIDEKE